MHIAFMDVDLRKALYAQYCQLVRDLRSLCAENTKNLSEAVKKEYKSPVTGCGRCGPKEKLSEQQKRRILCCFMALRENAERIACKRLMLEAGITMGMISERTLSRSLNKEGYFHLQARKKGLLSRQDLKTRLAFARRMQMDCEESVWESQETAFYLDGKSFLYKTNAMEQALSPKGRIWRKPSKGLAYGCTATGQKRRQRRASFEA